MESNKNNVLQNRLRICNEEMGQVLGKILIASKKQGGLSRIAKETGLSRESLYRSFSKKGNPTLKTMLLSLNAMGLAMEIKQRQ